ncbi:murein biosynthesis integral membrane protein MurJ [Nakamurella sp. A5-74]|uniref:Murein biosynthesis integral membrane protein MurJ n=1 Tax=Nakamurella sp. A5-74 TaxID=3158264 RepID=A0AAU8DN84_9ACTN
MTGPFGHDPRDPRPPDPRQAQREQAQREQAQREQAQREQAQREQAQREQAQGEHAQREHAQRERAQREQAPRVRAAPRDRAAPPDPRGRAAPPDPRGRDRVADGPWERRPPPRPQDAWPARRPLTGDPEQRDSLTGGPRLRPPPPPEPVPLLYPGMEDATQLIQRISDAAGPPEVHVLPAVEQTMRIAERPIAPRRDAQPRVHDGRRQPGQSWPGGPPARQPGGPPQRPPRGYRRDDPPTELIPKIRLAPESAVTEATATPEAAQPTARAAGIAKAGALLAVATLVSRLTGFVAKVLLGAALGIYIVNDSYNVANTLPNIVFELVIGGVLTSIAIPLLSRARKDPDGGELYTQRLMTVGIVGLLVITVLAVLAAPVFTTIYIGRSSKADPTLTTDLARLLLPQILFYGLAALFGAILNSKEKFAAPAWAPVVNNLVVIGVALTIARLPGGIFNPAGAMVKPSSTQLWLLGLGTTAGIVIQAAVMVPALLRSGFRFRWRWGGDPRLKQAGRLMVWSIAYALSSTVAFAVVSRVLTGHVNGGISTFAYASLLFQLPYGIVGVSLLTAIMPRMSRHAADGDLPAVKDDASLAGRLTIIALLPVAAAMVALGVPIASAAFQHGNVTPAAATSIGLTLTTMAVGLVPLAVTLIQMRVFYAMHDARTPTFINLIMVGVRVPLVLLCVQLPADRIVLGVALATTLSYVVGAVVGEIWLRHRFGSMGSRRMLVTGGKTLIAAVVAAGAAWWVADLIDPVERTWPASLLQLLAGALTGVLVLVPLLLALRLPELEPARRKLAALFGFPVPVAAAPATPDPTVAARPASLAPSDGRARPPGQPSRAPDHRPGAMDPRQGAGQGQQFRPSDRQPPVRPGPGVGGAPMPPRTPPQVPRQAPPVPRGPAPRPPAQQHDPNSRPPRPPQAPPDRRRQP